MTPEEREDRIEQLEEARNLIHEAIDLIRGAIMETPLVAGAESYIIPSLSMCAQREHGWLGSQPYNIDELIDALRAASN